MVKERLLKMKKICFFMALVMILLSPVLAFAESYSGFELTCTCSITSTKGKASTSGATKPYYNYVSVIVYKNGDSKASNLKRVEGSEASTTASYSLGGLTKAMSNHYVCNSSYNPVGNARETIVKYAER
ncbi:MAG: hypothetical protein K2K56_10660 [Lachnospiraceae bacterium]|nr:hypothetical protein [Lachnospiraceae bacterium]